MPLQRPFVFINAAMSADGKISTVMRRQVRISGEQDIKRVDLARADCDAIMVGVGTVLADDPGLRIKGQDLKELRISAGRGENPLRVVADSMARTPTDAKVLGDGAVLAVSSCAPAERLSALEGRCKILVCGHSRVDLPLLMDRLHQNGVKTLMVEGGGELCWSLISSGLVDEIYSYIGPLIIGGRAAPTLVDGDGCAQDMPELNLISSDRIDGGILLRWRVP